MLRAISRFPSKHIHSKSRRAVEFKLYKTVRCYSEVCPPPKKGSSSSGAIYTLGALALVGGATIGYAKYDREFRQTLVEYVPFTDDVIKFVFQEEQSFLSALSSLYEGSKKSISGAVAPKIKEIPRPDVKPYQAPPPVISGLETPAKSPESYTEIRVDDKQSDECHIGGAPKPKDEPLPETHPTSLAELEDRISETAAEAVNAYNEAIYQLKVYNQEVGALLDGTVDQVNPQVWDSIRQKTRAKNDAIKDAQDKADQASKDVNKLKSLLSKTETTASPATREMIKIKIQKVQDDIADAKNRFKNEYRMGSTTEKYWDRVQKARQHFSEELEALFPTIDISNKEMVLNEADLDLFLLHAYANIVLYQKELARLETIGHERLEAAVEAAKRGGGEALTTAQVCEAVDIEKRNLAIAFQKQCLKLRRESEHELREQLKLQQQVFYDHFEDELKTRSMEIERALMRKFDEQLEEEQIRFKTQLAVMVGRLRGLDQVLKARDATAGAAKQSQVLWSACHALLRAIKTGCPGIPWKDQLRPLSPEITLVTKAAAEGDELVAAVINGIPKEAKERGVFPEDALRERFLKVEEVARNVALVPEEGGALPLHILSYIQAMFLIRNPSPIPQAELNDEEVDFSKLSTNEILQRARYWLDRGDFAQTLKYMNLLDGAPRSIARQWMNETRILLETQQAANTLMAHAASSGLLHL